MKKLIATLLVLAITVTVITVGLVTSASAAVSAGQLLNDFDSLNFGGLTGNIVTYGPYPTLIAIDSSVKNQGSASLKISGDSGQNIYDGVDFLFFSEYNQAMNLSAVDSFSFDIRTSAAFNNSNASISVNFVTGTSGEDGYNIRVNLGSLGANTWKTITLNKSAAVKAIPSTDWSNIQKIVFMFRNPDNVTEPDIYIDNFKATGTTVISNGLINDYDSLNYGGKTEILSTYTVFPTLISIDSSVKSQGSASLKIAGDSGNNDIDSVDFHVSSKYNAPMNLSGATGFSIALRTSAAINDSGVSVQVAFVTNSSSDDGFNYRFNLGSMPANTWKTFTIDKSAPTYTAPGSDWSSIVKVVVLMRNSNNITEPDFYIDNLVATSDSTSVVTPSGDSFIVNDYDSLDFGGKTENLSTYVVFPTLISFDSSVKSQGSASLKIAGDSGNNDIDSVDFHVSSKYNSPMDLSGVTKFTIDLRTSAALNDSGVSVQIAFVTNSSSDDGFNYRFNLGSMPANTWKTFTIDKSAPTYTAPGSDWSSIVKVVVLMRNSNNITEPDFYIDNLVALNSQDTTTSSVPTTSEIEPDDDTFMVHNFDSQTFGGKTQNFVTYGVYATTFGIDSSKKSQGSASLRIDGDTVASAVPSVDAMIKIPYNSAMDLSSYKEFSIDFYLASAISDSTFGIEIRFVTTEGNQDGNQDGFNYTITGLDEYASGQWHTFKIPKRRIAKPSTVVSDWTKIKEVYFIVKNSQQISEPNIYLDNLIAYTPVTSTVTSSQPVASQVTSDVPSTPIVDVVYGDLTGDGIVKSTDALATLQYSVRKITLTDEQLVAADVDGNGTVNATDALIILQYSVGKIDNFPVDNATPSTSEVPSATVVVPDSIIDNGAYTKDTTADTTFVLTGKGLESKKAYFISNLLLQNTDNERLVYSLQGLVNRDFAMDAEHESIIYVQASGQLDGTWYNEMIKEGSVYEGFEKVQIKDWETFTNTFGNQLKHCGMVLWDTNVPATANVAATICGLDGYLPVRKGSQLQTDLEAIGVEVKLDLCGMFTGTGTIPGTNLASTGSTKNDAYRWAIEKYFNRCSSKYLAYTLDGAPTVEGHKCHEDRDYESDCLENHDYIIARRMFVFDLSCRLDYTPDDDPNQKLGTDRETMFMIFQKRYDRANGEFGQILGFPPWWLKYIYGDNTGSSEAVRNEWMFSEIVTCFNLAKEADASAPAFMNNGSAYYKYRFLTKNFKNSDPTTNYTYDTNTKYYTVYNGDYDSSAWMKKHVISHWMKDSARGTFAMNWGYNPNLSDRIPLVFDYVCQNKTANDYLVAGDSGAGYIVPAGLTKGQTLATSGYKRTNPSAHSKWADYCKYYYSRFDMDVTGFILTTGNPLTTADMDAYNQISGIGNLHIDGQNRFVSRNGVPYIYMATGYSDKETFHSYLTGTMGSYNFGAVRVICETPTTVKGIIDDYNAYAAGKGVKVQYVDIYSLFKLAKQSGKLVAK